MRKAIIFDLDGTLWDSIDQIVPVYNQIISRHQEAGDTLVDRETLEKCMGKTVEEIGRILFPSLDAPEQKTIMDEIIEGETGYLRDHGGRLYDGLEETLTILKRDYDLFIVSNSQDGYVQSFLTAHDLGDFFKDYEMSGRVGLTKGKSIRLVMGRNHVSEGVYVGDTRGDEEAAREAGLPFIYAAYGFGTAKKPDKVIRSIRELPEIL